MEFPVALGVVRADIFCLSLPIFIPVDIIHFGLPDIPMGFIRKQYRIFRLKTGKNPFSYFDMLVYALPQAYFFPGGDGM
jgi:hypothetical protein